jgi:hypothetical protein
MLTQQDAKDFAQHIEDKVVEAKQQQGRRVLVDRRVNNIPVTNDRRQGSRRMGDRRNPNMDRRQTDRRESFRRSIEFEQTEDQSIFSSEKSNFNTAGILKDYTQIKEDDYNLLMVFVISLMALVSGLTGYIVYKDML